jgi:hypothetical protein
MLSTVIDEETGEEKKRLINRGRWRGYGPASIVFVEQTVYSPVVKLFPSFDNFISLSYQRNPHR